MRSLQLFTELGYAQAKGARTRMFNKLKLVVTEEIDDNTVNMILDEIISSKSKAEIKAKAKELKGSIKKTEQIATTATTSTKEPTKPKVKVTLDVSNELLVKYGVNMEDVQEKYNILYNQNALDKESLDNRKKAYRFPYDKQIISLLEELCL